MAPKPIANTPEQKNQQFWNKLNTFVQASDLKDYLSSKTTEVTDHFNYTVFKKQEEYNNSKKKYLHDGKYAQDSNFITPAIPQISTSYFRQMNNILINNVFMGYAELAVLLQNPILNAICRIKSNEVVNKWIELVSVNDEDNKTDKITELEKELERLDVKTKVREALYNAYAFGGNLMYFKLRNDEDELTKPLIIDDLKINKGDLQYIQCIDPNYYTPLNYDTIHPLSEWFYKPLAYLCLNQEIHESRVFKLVMNEVPDILKPTYYFNGISLLQQCAPYVMNFETMRTTIIQIAQRYNLSVLKTDLEALMSMPNDAISTASLTNRIAMFNYLRDNLGTLAIDMKSEDFMQLSMTLSHLDRLLEIYSEHICVPSRLTVTKLFGKDSKGLNATGEHELNNYYDMIRAEQEIVTPMINKIIHLAMLNKWGKIDEGITFKWLNLDTADEIQESQIKLNLASEISQYMTQGVITREQACERLANDPKSGWDNLEFIESDFENEEIEPDPEIEEPQNEKE